MNEIKKPIKVVLKGESTSSKPAVKLRTGIKAGSNIWIWAWRQG